MSHSDTLESRGYKHTRCKMETVVGDNSYEVMSNPLSDMVRTWCTTCNSFFPIEEFTWSDTGETIPAYYARHSAKATPFERFLCSRKGLLLFAAIGFIAGAIGGYFLFRTSGIGAKIFMIPFVGFLGVVLFASINLFGITKVITKRVCGVSDTRTLR